MPNLSSSLSETNNAQIVLSEIRPTYSRRLLGALRGSVLVIHPLPVAVVVATSGALMVVAHGGWPGLGFLTRATGTVLATQVAIGSLNDYLDRDLDARYQPWKPIPAGTISAKAALTMVAFSLCALIPLGLSFGPAALLIILVAASGGLTYDLRLKQTPLSLLGYLIGFLGLGTWIWLVAGHLTARFLLAVPLGALIVLTAHLLQSLPDIESDRSLGQRGLAVVLGPRRTFAMSGVAFAIACATVLGWAIAASNVAALGLCLVAVGTGFAAFAVQASKSMSVASRKRIFAICAPGLGVLAIATLIMANP